HMLLNVIERHGNQPIECHGSYRRQGINTWSSTTFPEIHLLKRKIEDQIFQQKRKQKKMGMKRSAEFPPVPGTSACPRHYVDRIQSFELGN
ncbi:unnamed protein product, partial [Heterotrigona itama]